MQFHGHPSTCGFPIIGSTRLWFGLELISAIRQVYALFKTPQAATAVKHTIDSFGDGQHSSKKFSVIFTNPCTNPFKTTPKDGAMRNGNMGSSRGGYNPSGAGGQTNGYNNSAGYRGRGGFNNRGGMNNNSAGGYSRGGYQGTPGGYNSGGFQNNPMGGAMGYAGFNNRGGAMMGGMRGGQMGGMRGGRGGMPISMGMPNMGMGGMPAMGMAMPNMGMPGKAASSTLLSFNAQDGRPSDPRLVMG